MLEKLLQWLRRLFGQAAVPALTNTSGGELPVRPRNTLGAMSDVPLTLSGSRRGELLVLLPDGASQDKVREAFLAANANCGFADDDQRLAVLGEMVIDAVRVACSTGRGAPPQQAVLQDFLDRIARPAIAQVTPPSMRSDPELVWYLLVSTCGSKILEALVDGKHHDRSVSIPVDGRFLTLTLSAIPAADGPAGAVFRDRSLSLLSGLAVGKPTSVPGPLLGALGLFVEVAETMPGSTEVIGERASGSPDRWTRAAREGLVQGQVNDRACRHGVALNVWIAWAPGAEPPPGLRVPLFPAEILDVDEQAKVRDLVAAAPPEDELEAVGQDLGSSPRKLAASVDSAVRERLADRAHPFGAVYQALLPHLREDGLAVLASTVTAAMMETHAGERSVVDDTVQGDGLTIGIRSVAFPCGVDEAREEIQRRIAQDIETICSGQVHLAVLTYVTKGMDPKSYKLFVNVLPRPSDEAMLRMPAPLRIFAVYGDLLLPRDKASLIAAAGSDLRAQ